MRNINASRLTKPETTKGGTIGKSKILARLKAGKSCKNEDINVNKDKGIKPITEYDRTIDGRSESIWQHVNSLTWIRKLA